MARIKVDLHDVFNSTKGIDKALNDAFQEAKELPSHRLTVSGRADVERFLDLVGGVGSRKASACAEIRRQFADVTPNPTRDTIPSAAWRTAVVRAIAPAGLTARPQALSRQRASPVAERVRSAQLSALLPGTFAVLLGALLVFVNVAPNTWQIKLRPRVWQGMAAGIGAAVAIMTISQPHPFIYFQF